MTERTLLEKMTARHGHLHAERSSWIGQWQDISDYTMPYTGRFFASDRNQGKTRFNRIYDNTGTRAARTLAAGMLGGLTSPARPWFRLKTGDPALDEFQPVKMWLAQVTRTMQGIFADSNTYRALHNIYLELGLYGTAASTVLDDFDNGIWHYGHTAGEYMLATDYRGVVDTFYREFDKTVAQLVKEFGYKNCSKSVQNQYDNGSLEQWVTIIHAVEPRADRDHKLADAKNMAYASCYFEKGNNDKQFLRESGMKRFRVLTPRWLTVGGDIYGQSPGMETLGDIKQLQHEQTRKSQGIDYQTRPPLQAPTSMKHQEVDGLPGGVTFVDSTGNNAGIRPSWEARIDLNYLLQDIQDVRQRIKEGFYSDLFLMLAGQDNGRMTATEVAERHEEKLLMLGPVLERLHNELLDPLIEITFDRMIEAGIVPPPPDELNGVALNVDFVSLLAQAQRAVANNTTDRFVGNLGIVAQMKPEVLDKFDADQWADSYSDQMGVDPALIVADEKVAIIRQERAAAQQAAAQQEQMVQMADMAAKAGTIDTSGRNAAADVMNQLQGYNSPGAQSY